MTQKKLDYRKSHIAKNKGKNYQKAFIEKKYRKSVWSWEKNVLNEIIKKYLADKKQIKYLDFACGTGRIITYLEKNMFESIGVDVSDSMLNIASENVKKSKIIKVDITKKNIFEDNYFDFITAFRFFLNAQQNLREDAFSAISKILHQDGYFVFNIHLNKTSIFFRLIHFYHKIKGLNSESNAVSIKEATKIVEENEMQIVTTFHYGVIPIFNEDTKIPMWLIDPFEKLASKTPYFKHFSRYLIFVCKHQNM